MTVQELIQKLEASYRAFGNKSVELGVYGLESHQLELTDDFEVYYDQEFDKIVLQEPEW